MVSPRPEPAPDARPALPPSREAELEQLARDVSKSSLLVIEDDDAIREALAELLELSGYWVAVAADGEEGIELLELGFRPGAIILDLMMPRMDGWTFLERLRRDERFHHVPVVVTSAVASETPREADACLQKPFELSQLDHEVAKLCAH